MRCLYPLLIASVLSFPGNVMAFDQQTLLKVFFSIVQVHTNNGDGKEGFGSGIVVSNNQVVTNCHVLRKGKTVWVSQGEDAFAAESVQADDWHDLCLLTTSHLPFSPAEIGSVTSLQNSDQAFSIGHSSGVYAPTTSRGQIKALYPYEDSLVIRTSARFAMGASGSGLFNDQGQLVGINAFKTFGHRAYFYAMPADWIAALETLPMEPIGPRNKTAFWEDGSRQPYFLQAALPELQEKWHDLLAISKQWVAAEPANAEAWYELGLAQQGIGERENAHHSFRKATRINPHHGDALFRLGVFAAERGNREEMRSISVALTQIDSDLAENFRKTVGCEADC